MNAVSDMEVTWTRRTRLNGDSWNVYETPLGEVDERYLVRVRNGAVVVREETVTAPAWLYTTTAQVADLLTGAFEIEVAQISQKYGPGPFNRIVFDV